MILVCVCVCARARVCVRVCVCFQCIRTAHRHAITSHYTSAHTHSLVHTRAHAQALKSINESLTKRNVMLEATNAGLQGAHEAMRSQQIGQHRQIHEMESQVLALRVCSVCLCI